VYKVLTNELVDVWWATSVIREWYSCELFCVKNRLR